MSPWQLDFVRWVLDNELASHQPSGAMSTDIAPRMLGNLCTSGLLYNVAPHLAQHTGISKSAAANAEILPTQHTTLRIMGEEHGEILKLLLELTDNQSKASCQWLLVRQSRHVYTHFSMCTYMLMCSMCSFSQKCVLWQVYSLFQSEFTECNVVLPLSIFTILSSPYGHPVAAYILFLVFLSLLSFFLFPSVTYFRRQFLHKMWPIRLIFHSFTVCRIVLSSTLQYFISHTTDHLHPSPAPHCKTLITL